MRRFTTLLVAALAILIVQVAIQAQTTGSISGTVLDPNKAVVAGAAIVVSNDATKQQYTAVSNEEGNFRIPNVGSGVYTATVTGKGFKTTIVKQIKVDVGSSSTLPISMEIGGAAEQVTVVGGGELLRTDNATAGTTITGRQITDIPTASRNALDVVLALPGTGTPGRPRTSSVNGLPKGALNISIDGINVQDNLLKSNDGFFTYVQPKTDAVSEVSLSTSTPGAESSGEGAVQIKFVTQGGGNTYHGGAYWYSRNPQFNANYWFNNRDLPADPVTHKAPQSRILLNQPGVKFGGPISIPGLFSGKDKLFFFVNYEEYLLPERTLRTRTILSPQAQAGTHRFYASTTYAPPATTSCVAATNPNTNAPAQLCSTNVLTLGGTTLGVGTADPTISALLGQIRSSVANYTIKDTGDPNLQQVSFNNVGGQTRYFPTVRFDINVIKNHHVENIWNYQLFTGKVDFLNSVDPVFPGFPNQGSQNSNRFSNATAWRWTISNTIVNEARFGLTGGSVLFFPQVNAGQFANQGGYSQGIGAFGINGATATTGPQRRNTPVKQFTDTFTWITGNHSFNFGTSLTRINFWQQLITVVPSTVYTTSSTLDVPGFNAFSSLASGGVQNSAATLYNVLAGRLTAINANARLSETTGNYTYLGDLVSRAQQTEYGFFGQDTWRFRPNITLTGGIRYEKQLPFTVRNKTYTGVSYADLFGESGVGNLFKPGTLSGGHSTYNLVNPGSPAYNPQPGSFAPSVGLVYSPKFDKGFMHTILGNSGQSVFRGGFSMAYIREGINTFQSILGSNPGGAISTNLSLTLGNLPVGSYLRNGPYAKPAFPTSLTVPNNGLITDSVNAFASNIKIGYVESWTASYQREITSDTVFEARYVGNRGHKLWRQYDMNELNIIENGVGAEWKIAQQNLLANIAANRCQTGVTAAGCQLNFAYFGPGTGTSPLPISLAYFSGLANNVAGGDPTVAANYASSNFRSSTFFNTMNPLNPSPLGFGSALSSTSFDNRRTPAGQACFGISGCTGLGLFPYNMFLVNPGKRGGAFVMDNGSQTWYDAVTFEVRRRFSKGLLIQSSYTFGKALGNTYASSSAAFDQPSTLRDPLRRKSVAPFNITHGFKTNFIYELPVGRGQWLAGDAPGWLNTIVGGWGINGNVRIQSGSPFSMGNVQLIGMTQKQLQKMVGVYKEADGFVYVFPKAIRDNTFFANTVAFSTVGSTGAVYSNGTPTGQYIAPAGAGNCPQFTTGSCGLTNMVLRGPHFTRFDISLVKKIKLTERANLEFRSEFLNAFNNINFLVGAAGNDINTLGSLGTASFGRITAAYQDLSTTNDPGGRLIQFVARINF